MTLAPSSGPRLGLILLEWPAVIYFVLLALFITLLMLNLFVVVVTESYEVLADKVRRDELV